MRDWLVEARKQKGFSQKEVCDAIGISQPTYWEYEHEVCKPTPYIAKKIGDVLGFDWTLFYEDTPINSTEKAV